jgi:hypothetical protein
MLGSKRNLSFDLRRHKVFGIITKCYHQSVAIALGLDPVQFTLSCLTSSELLYINLSLFYTVALETEREFKIKFIYITVIRITTEEVNIISKYAILLIFGEMSGEVCECVSCREELERQ